MLPQKDKKPSPPQSRFRKQQVAEDTEREMTGRPQIHGAAMMDDEPEGPITPPGPGDAPATDEQAAAADTPGGMLPGGDPAAVEDQMPDPDAAATPEDAEAQADAHIGKTGGAEKMVAKHHGHIHDIHKRLAALEAKKGGPPDSSAPGAPEAVNDYDDDGR